LIARLPPTMTVAHDVRCASSPRLWRFKFQTRTLLLVVGLVCVALAALGTRLRDAQKQRQTVAAIRGAGGLVFYDYEYDFTLDNGRQPGRQRSETPSPFLLGLFGQDAIANVVYVQFESPQVSDSDLVHLDKLPHLQHLQLAGTRVSDEAIGKLQTDRPILSVTGQFIKAR
jgi:hypothetical protein